MSNFSFKLPSGESFEIKMPSGATFEQAKAIFDQQAGSGGLVGFKVGDALSAATQAADGLAAAAPQLAQGLASATKLLPAGIDTSSITAALGPGGAAAAGQLSSALQGSIPAISSGITGASAGINGLVSGITSQVGAGFGSLQSALPGAISAAQANLPGELASMQAKLPAAIGALTGQAAQIGSLANQAVQGLSKAIGGVPTAGINVADFAKQLPALGDIGNLSKADVTGVLAQASKLVGQASDQISNTLGAGKFGFDAGQLEKAGLLKPGTAAAFLAGGEADLVNVLKSPVVWTGKDGVKGLDNLLNNVNLQDKVQQGLMASGLQDLKTLGVPTDALKPQALAGLATNAAKSVSDTLKWATGLGAVPGLPNLPSVPALPENITAKFNAAATNGAFAVNLVENKVEPPAKQEVIVEPAANTVNAATLTAAAERVVGNDKVPSVIGNSGSNDAATKTALYIALVGNTYADALSIDSSIANLESASTISQAAWNNINQEFIAVKATYNARIEEVEKTAVDAINSLGAPQNTNLIQKFTSAQELISKFLFPLFDSIKQKLKTLANKIAT